MMDLFTYFANIIFTSLVVITTSCLLFIFLPRISDLLFSSEGKRSGYILVTGCDTGFGYGTALELSNRGMYVFAGCLTAEGVARLSDDNNFNGMALLMDITDTANVARVKNLIEVEVKDAGLWCLINNAGINQLGPFEWLSLEQMKNVMNVNLWGMVNVTKTMLPLIKKAEGRVVNMSSIMGRMGARLSAAYCMSKYAVEAFSDCLRYEMKVWGVSVHIVEPGSHSTPFISVQEEYWDELWNRQPQAIQEDYGEFFRKQMVAKLQQRMKLMSADTRNVINAYCHAALSSSPKTRYVVGIDASTVGVLLATLPTSLADMLMAIFVRSPTIPAARMKMS